MEPAILPENGAAIPRRFRLSRQAAIRAAAIAVAALLAFVVFQAYRRPGFLIDLVNLRLC